MQALHDAELTERQLAIVKQVALRTPIKEIAYELGVAPSTVNDHLAAAKRKLGVRTTRDLVSLVLAEKQAFGSDDVTPQIGGHTKNRIGLSESSPQQERKDKPVFSFHDSMALGSPDDWYTREPAVVPEALDGENATTARLIAIAKFAALIMTCVILAGTALVAIEMAMDSGAGL